MSDENPPRLIGCRCCGLVQTVAPLPANYSAYCSRCHSALPTAGKHGRNRLAAALALSALVFYMPAMLLPMLRIERLGHAHQDSLLSGISALWGGGHWLVGALILLFSVILPPAKLLALAWLAGRGPRQHRHRALVYRAVEAFGRWSMLDVMLVALLIAFVKLGDAVTIAPGAGLTAFASLVALSLLASAVFDPHALWPENRP